MPAVPIFCIYMFWTYLNIFAYVSGPPLNISTFNIQRELDKREDGVTGDTEAA